MLIDPSPDTVFSNLKWLATKSGPFGPYFEKGMQFVIDQIERTGHFTPDPVATLWPGNAGTIPTNVHMDAERLAQARGLSGKNATVFARGVARAESELAFYKVINCG